MSRLSLRKIVMPRAGFWEVSQVEHVRSSDRWSQAVEGVMADRPEVASVSIVAPQAAAGAGVYQAATAALPLCFLNDAVADLIGMTGERDQPALDDLERWVATATRKGLLHLWIASDEAVALPPRTIPADHLPRLVPAGNRPAPRAISLAIDAAWLLGGESGAQVFAFELLRELARREQIAGIAMLSDSGGVPEALAGIDKVQGMTWTAAIAGGRRFHIVHRPYQPSAGVDYQRYHQVAGAVAVTVLDFIAYDNPAYHEDDAAWREYQELFDTNVCRADRVFAISDSIGTRLQRQFAHRLTSRVAAIHPGTDHLTRAGARPTEPVPQLAQGRFLLVLGNDFEHKNRDFAVRVFHELRDRGYDGRLALVGFHLDLGSTYARELDGAGPHRDSIVRLGPVSSDQKRWLLAHADVVLYPTSSEGFGFVPFEAASLATPTAFVRFGALRETLPAVAACPQWSIPAYADHVQSLLADPARQLAQIADASAPLTWKRCADRTLEAYVEMLQDESAWQSQRPPDPVDTGWQRVARHPRVRRFARAARRLTGRVTR